ncbi:MAG: hypothetical protein ACT4OY_05540 [Alphaproteobacteria bacterium]
MTIAFRLPIVGVMGSHEHTWEELSAPVGRMIARKGWHLLTGGGGGVMVAVAKAFMAEKKRKGLSIGIIPTFEKEGQFLRRSEYPNPYIEIPVITPLDIRVLSDAMPYSRNHVNVMTSDVVIILPGSHGTQNEASLSLMLNKPHILYGPPEAFAGFPEGGKRVHDFWAVEHFVEDALTAFSGSYSI